MKQARIAVVVGTRPEGIKIAPVYLTLKKDERFDVRLITTAQHRQMLDQVLKVFSIQPDVDLRDFCISLEYLLSQKFQKADTRSL